MGLPEPSGSGARKGRPAEVVAQGTRCARTEGARMSGAGRGVTPGAEPEAGPGDSAASAEPEQARPSSADNGAEAPDQAKAQTSDAQTGKAEAGKAQTSKAEASGKAEAEAGTKAEASGPAEDGDGPA